MTDGTWNGSNAGQATAKLTGSGFTPSTAVSLVAGATTRAASAVQFVDGSTLFATFDLTNLAPGAYDVQVVEAAQTAVAAGAFTVSARAPGQIRTYVSSPAFVRPGRTYPVRIDYFNDGDTDLPAPLLELNAQNALMRLPGEQTFQCDSMHVLGINHEGPAGILPPGYHGSDHRRIPAAVSVSAAIRTTLICAWWTRRMRRSTGMSSRTKCGRRASRTTPGT